MKSGIVAAIALSLLLATGTASAQGRGRGHSKGKEHAVVVTRVPSRVIVDWYGAHPAERRYTALPPGLAKQLRRNGTLPPGLRGSVRPLPVALVRVLPPLRAGREYVLVGDRVLLLDRPSWTVLDFVVVL